MLRIVSHLSIQHLVRYGSSIYISISRTHLGRLKYMCKDEEFNSLLGIITSPCLEGCIDVSWSLVEDTAWNTVITRSMFRYLLKSPRSGPI